MVNVIIVVLSVCVIVLLAWCIALSSRIRDVSKGYDNRISSYLEMITCCKDMSSNNHEMINVNGESIRILKRLMEAKLSKTLEVIEQSAKQDSDNIRKVVGDGRTLENIQSNIIQLTLRMKALERE